MHFLKRIAVNGKNATTILILGLTLCQAGHAQSRGDETKRGNSFGNGGDRIREIANAGRIFAQDILKAFKDEEKLMFLETKERQLYLRVYDQAMNHTNASVHYWEKHSALTDCARLSEDARIVNLSYEHCPAKIPTAYEAAGKLLTLSLEGAVHADKASSLKDISTIRKVIGPQLLQHWTLQYSEAVDQAKNIRYADPAISGDWDCEVSGKIFPVKIFESGAVIANLPYDAANLGSGHNIIFANAISLSKDRGSYVTEGILTLKRNRQGNVNIKMISECEYPALATIPQPKVTGELDFSVRVSARARVEDGCPAIDIKNYDVSCKAKGE